MKKLKSILVLFLLLSVTLMMGSNVEAAQGKLTSSSIVASNRHGEANDVAKADKSDSGADKVDTLTDQEDTTPEISPYVDPKVKTQDPAKEDEGSNLGVVFITGLIGGAIGGGVAGYLVKRKKTI